MCTVEKVGRRCTGSAGAHCLREAGAGAAQSLHVVPCSPPLPRGARLQMLIKGIRSFSPDNQDVIEFYKPLTLIVGHNGAGKTVRPRMPGRQHGCAPGGGRLPHAATCMPLPAHAPADDHRVPEAGHHGGAATQHQVRAELHP